MKRFILVRLISAGKFWLREVTVRSTAGTGERRRWHALMGARQQAAPETADGRRVAVVGRKEAGQRETEVRPAEADEFRSGS